MALAAPVRIVHLHDAAKREVAIAINHRLHQFLLEQPRRVVRHAQLPVHR